MEIYELNLDSIKEQVEAKKPGNYWLYRIDDNGEPVVRYIGRSDKCIATRLKKHVWNEVYDAFSFLESTVFPRVRNAHEIECREFHLLRDQLDNKIHPDAPRNLPYTCKFCKLEQHLAEKNSEGVGSQ